MDLIRQQALPSREDDGDSSIPELLLARIAQLETRLMATVDDATLMALWQSFDGLETSDEAITGEMVDDEMARRGLFP